MSDCNEIQAKDVACNEISLTEQWKKGETRNEQADSRCKMELQAFLRWHSVKPQNIR